MLKIMSHDPNLYYFFARGHALILKFNYKDNCKALSLSDNKNKAKLATLQT